MAVFDVLGFCGWRRFRGAVWAGPGTLRLEVQISCARALMCVLVRVLSTVRSGMCAQSTHTCALLYFASHHLSCVSLHVCFHVCGIKSVP